MALTDLLNKNPVGKWIRNTLAAGMIVISGYNVTACSFEVKYPSEDAIYQKDNSEDDSYDAHSSDSQAEVRYECPGKEIQFYQDKDEDGFGNPNAPKLYCDEEQANAENYVSNKLDFDDADGNSYPGASEICDEIDNNGNGKTDESLETIVCAPDSDKDGFGNGQYKIETCKPVCPDGMVLYAQDDCNDNDNKIKPGATESCDLTDSDCDGLKNNGVVKYEACGLNGNGKQESICDENATWVVTGTCVDPDECVDGEVKHLTCSNNVGICKEGTQKNICAPGDDNIFRYYPIGDCNGGILPEATDDNLDGLDNNCDGVVDDGNMVEIPEGIYSLGCDISAGNMWCGSENVAHSIKLSAYKIDVYEVTNKQYRECVNAGVCTKQKSLDSYTHIGYADDPQSNNKPAIYVDWERAQTYCKEWAGKDLPTEAQWEIAAKSNEPYMFPWGNDYPDGTKANYNVNVGDTTAVGSYPDGASPYGVMDMAGNVSEWVKDSFKPYTSDFQVDPVFLDGNIKLIRGGAWGTNDNKIQELTTYFRISPNKSTAEMYIGFRCAKKVDNNQ